MQNQTHADSSAKLLRVFFPRALAVLVIFAVAGGLIALLILSKGKNQKRPPISASITVQTITAEHQPTDRIWSGYGTARTMQSAELVAEVSGRVIERPDSIEDGQQVAQGDLIVRLDDRDYLNTLDSAKQALRSIEAQLDGLRVESEQMQLQVKYAGEEIEAAQRDLTRIEAAIDQGAGNEGERDTKLSALLRLQRQEASLRQQLELIPSRKARLEAELSAQRASERIALENVQRSTIRAPFAGRLGTVGPRVGDWVAVGTSVARVVDLARIEVPLKVPASASGWVRMGDEARLWARSPGGVPDFVGRVVRIAPEADTSSRTVTVYVEVEQDPQDADRLLPGQFVHGRVKTHDEHDRVILPRRAVQSDHVFVVGQFDHGSRLIERIPVKVAYSFEADRPEVDPIESQWVALELGYEPVEGSGVVVSLLDQLIAGMRVRLEDDPLPTIVDESAAEDDQDAKQDPSDEEGSP